MFAGLMSVVLKRLVVSNDKVNGRVLRLDIGWHCLVKKSRKIWPFSRKLVANLLLINKRGMVGTFFQLIKVLISEVYLRW